MEFAGAQFAAWRKKMGVTQRQLADEKLISQAPLVHFERGRSWPREGMRAKLEERLGLPAGQIAKWRYGFESPTKPTAIPGRIDFIVPALEMAVQSIAKSAETLPPPDDPQYWPVVVDTLRDLRRLDTTVVSASRVSPTEAVLTQLRAVRRIYDAVIRAAAIARPNEYGPQLYLARTSAQMSNEEAAAAAGVSEEMITAVESCQVEAPPEVRALLLRLGVAN
jgi:transcriptional regulator with XRE-family HTH domain